MGWLKYTTTTTLYYKVCSISLILYGSILYDIVLYDIILYRTIIVLVRTFKQYYYTIPYYTTTTTITYIVYKAYSEQCVHTMFIDNTERALCNLAY